MENNVAITQMLEFCLVMTEDDIMIIDGNLEIRLN